VQVGHTHLPIFLGSPKGKTVRGLNIFIEAAMKTNQGSEHQKITSTNTKRVDDIKPHNTQGKECHILA